MRIEQILHRLAEIRNMMAAPDYDESQSEALLAEVRQLTAEKAQIESRAALTAELRRQVGADTIAQIQQQEQEARARTSSQEPDGSPASAVYRRAWLKNLAVRTGVPIFGDLTQEERAAFIATTANTGSVVPTTTLAELRRTEAPAVLVEVAYHDNWEDANWIINNIEAIGRNLALSVADILGVPFVEP